MRPRSISLPSRSTGRGWPCRGRPCRFRCGRSAGGPGTGRIRSARSGSGTACPCAAATLGSGTWLTIRSNSGARSLFAVHVLHVLRRPAGCGPRRRCAGSRAARPWRRWRRTGRRRRCGPVRVGVGAVDLVDAEDRLQAHLQRLGQHELGLRHDAFLGVDQQDAAVHHAEDALHLAAEVGVAGRVDDVDARLAGLAVPEHEVHLARMVMPRSRSWSLESMARSDVASLARNTPDWASSWSTSVVLPWSTWAMMAMLRIDMENTDFREEQTGFDAARVRRAAFTRLRDVYPPPLLREEIGMETGVTRKPLKFIGFAEVAGGCRFLSN
jgi:hypothetical protein